MKKLDDSAHYDFEADAVADGIENRQCGDWYDLRPVLDVLQTEVERRTQGGRKLVVLMGENHRKTMHIALGQSLLSRLLSSSSVLAYGLERSYDLLPHILTKSFDRFLPSDLKRALISSDVDGEWMLKSCKAAFICNDAPLADSNLLSFCEAEKISVRANDAPTFLMPNIEGLQHYLNNYDPVLRDVIARYAPAMLDKHIPACSPDGMYLRNQMMVEQALRHMKHANAQVYIQKCGLAHVYGDDRFYDNDRSEALFSQSLSVLFAQAGMDVLPVFMESMFFEEDLIPPEARDARKSGAIIRHLSDEFFALNDPYAEEYDAGAERACLERISNGSGGAFKVMPDQSTGKGGLLWQEVASLIPSWIEEAEERLRKLPAPVYKPS